MLAEIVKLKYSKWQHHQTIECNFGVFFSTSGGQKITKLWTHIIGGSGLEDCCSY